jgi:hypothetical protein
MVRAVAELLHWSQWGSRKAKMKGPQPMLYPPVQPMEQLSDICLATDFSRGTA